MLDNSSAPQGFDEEAFALWNNILRFYSAELKFEKIFYPEEGF